MATYPSEVNWEISDKVDCPTERTRGFAIFLEVGACQADLCDNNRVAGQSCLLRWPVD